MGSVAFDGVVLSDLYTVLVKRGVASRNVDYEAVPGRDGVAVKGVDYAPPTLSLVFVLEPGSDAPSAVRELSALLATREPRKLELGEDFGLYCMAMPYGEPSWRRLPNGSSVEFPFLIMDAAMYGTLRTATVPSGGSVTFTVGGTYPTKPKITASAAVRNSSTGMWGLTLDNGPVLAYAFGSNTSRAVSADCDTRSSRVDGDIALPTLSSTWFELEPGSHTVNMHTGTGAAVIEWRERWLA